MEKLKAFYIKYLKNYIVLLIAIAIAMNLLIETLARHSLFASLGFLFGSPLVFLCNTLIILAGSTPVAAFQKEDIFYLYILFAVPGAGNNKRHHTGQQDDAFYGKGFQERTSSRTAFQ